MVTSSRTKEAKPPGASDAGWEGNPRVPRSRRRAAGVRQAFGRARERRRRKGFRRLHDRSLRGPALRHGLGRARGPNDAERQLHGAHPDDVPIAQRSGAVHALIPDKRPVLAPKVFDCRPARRDGDQRMTPRDARGAQEDLRFGVAAEHVRTLVEREAAVQPSHDKGDVAAATRGQPGFGAGRRFAKRVAKPVHGPDESRPGGIVAERLANLAHEVGEVLFHYERGGPQSLLEIALGNRLRPIGDEDAQQVERFGRQRHAAAVAEQFPRFGVEQEHLESHLHRRTLPCCRRHLSPSTTNRSPSRLW